MKKKYIRNVIQYDTQGNKIHVYNNAMEASKYISNYDSIIRCCKGEYKTTSGYIFRFKGDPFMLPNKKKTSSPLY